MWLVEWLFLGKILKITEFNEILIYKESLILTLTSILTRRWNDVVIVAPHFVL